MRSNETRVTAITESTTETNPACAGVQDKFLPIDLDQGNGLDAQIFYFLMV
jgi:hypothetical protein